MMQHADKSILLGTLIACTIMLALVVVFGSTVNSITIMTLGVVLQTIISLIVAEVNK